MVKNIKKWVSCFHEEPARGHHCGSKRVIAVEMVFTQPLVFISMGKVGDL